MKHDYGNVRPSISESSTSLTFTSFAFSLHSFLTFSNIDSIRMFAEEQTTCRLSPTSTQHILKTTKKGCNLMRRTGGYQNPFALRSLLETPRLDLSAFVHIVPHRKNEKNRKKESAQVERTCLEEHLQNQI